MTHGFVRVKMGPVARIETINFLIKMASEYNSKFDSDIVVNPCKNRLSSPIKPYIEECSSPVSFTIVQCVAKSAENKSQANEIISPSKYSEIVQTKPIDESMCGEMNKDDEPDEASNDEYKSARNEESNETDRIVVKLIDGRSGKSENDVGAEPSEQAEQKESKPEFFMHRYENGKRAYKSFVCSRCPRVVRADRLKIKDRYECYECVNPKEKAIYDKNRNSKVSALD
jgi:hypothetical protein